MVRSIPAGRDITSALKRSIYRSYRHNLFSVRWENAGCVPHVNTDVVITRALFILNSLHAIFTLASVSLSWIRRFVADID